jgi:transposase
VVIVRAKPNYQSTAHRADLTFIREVPDSDSSNLQNKNLSFGFNPLNPELNSICYLLALLGAHHFPHVSRIRVKLLTFRQLMSYIYKAPILFLYNESASCSSLFK